MGNFAEAWQARVAGLTCPACGQMNRPGLAEGAQPIRQTDGGAWECTTCSHVYREARERP